jgi:hypothetical protein
MLVDGCVGYSVGYFGFIGVVGVVGFWLVFISLFFVINNGYTIHKY